MMRFARALMNGAALVSLLFLSSVAWAQTPEAATVGQEGSNENVLVTFRIGTIERGEHVPIKSYQLVVAAGTVGSRLLAGERVPFPTAAREPSGGGDDKGTMQTFVYQNVGFSSQVKAWIVDTKKIRLVAEIEDSRVRPGTDGEPPTVETRQLTVNAILTDGVPLDLTRVEGVTEQSGFVEVRAERLR